MEDFDLITLLERKLQAYVRLQAAPAPADAWLLEVRLYYEGAPAGSMTFTLHGHTREEAEQVARNIRHNEYLMHEIDQFLWGESD